MIIGILAETQEIGEKYKKKLRLEHQADKIIVVTTLSLLVGRKYDIIYETPLFYTNPEHYPIMNNLKQTFGWKNIKKLQFLLN